MKLGYFGYFKVWVGSKYFKIFSIIFPEFFLNGKHLKYGSVCMCWVDLADSDGSEWLTGGTRSLMGCAHACRLTGGDWFLCYEPDSMLWTRACVCGLCEPCPQRESGAARWAAYRRLAGGSPELVGSRLCEGVGLEEGEGSPLVYLMPAEGRRRGGAASPEMARRRRSSEKGCDTLFGSGFWLIRFTGARGCLLYSRPGR